MRKIKILKVNATAGAPGSIEVAGDFTQVFQGKFYRDPTTGEVSAPYTTPAPQGFALIKATTFEVVENAKHAGRYTVYSPVSAGDAKSSAFASGNTRINVNETIPAPAQGDPVSVASDGYITNISTYLLYTGTGTIVVPPTVNITSYPIELMGRDSSGWGEAFAQNFMNLARNFANPTAPANPFVGQTWYDTDDKQLRAWSGTAWDLVNRASYGLTHRHTQGTAAATWTITHGLNLPAPYTGFVQFYVERGDGPQVILPSKVEFVSANQMRVTFSNPERGYALIRQ